MAQAPRDPNRVPALLGTSDADGITPLPVYVDDATNRLMVDALISSETALTGIEGSPVTVGTTAVEMTFTATTKSITLLSDHDNTGKVWFGASDVDSSGNNAFGRLAAGQTVTIDEFSDSTTAIYAVSDTAGQTVIKAATA